MACSSCSTELTQTKKCSSCKRHLYCHRECQIKHWKNQHKQYCGWTKQCKINDQVLVTGITTHNKGDVDYTLAKIVQFPSENSGKFQVSTSATNHVSVAESDIHPPSLLFGNDWNKGAKHFQQLSTSRNPDQTYLKAMSFFQKSNDALKQVVLSTDPACASKYSVIYSARSLFLGYCWSDYDDMEQSVKEIEQAIKHGTKERNTLKDAYLELLMLYEERFDMVSARQVADRSIRDARYNSVWTHSMQRPGQTSKDVLSSRPWWDEQNFSFVKVLEKNYLVILEEFNHARSRVLEDMHDVGDHTLRETEDGRVVEGRGWKETVLFGTNARPDVAPRTCCLLEECLSEEALSLCEIGGGEIIFSYLYPETIIKPHCAATNHRLTCHLGLVVPVIGKGDGEEEGDDDGGKEDGEEGEEEDCSITVGGEKREWSVGKCMVFDDSFEHQVCNTTKEHRGILLIRFWHPDLDNEEKRVAAFESAIQERRRQHERRFDVCLQ